MKVINQLLTYDSEPNSKYNISHIYYWRQTHGVISY